MTQSDSPEPALLGLPQLTNQADILRLIQTLREIWQTAAGRPPGPLDSDLEYCRLWFDPVATGERIRKQLESLPEVSPSLVDPGDPMTLSVGPHRLLLTPEGRCALELLETLPTADALVVIHDAMVQPYERMLAATYRQWSRHRINSVLALLEGTDKPLQIPAAGVVIALLVNRCNAEARAFTRVAPSPVDTLINQAFFSAVQAFTTALSPRSRGNKTEARLVQGWMLYEARRRLGRSFVVENSRSKTGKVWIRPGDEDTVIDIVARDLARGHRARVSLELFETAFDALVVAFRQELPKLASYGLAHERPLETERIRKQLASRLAHHLAASA